MLLMIKTDPIFEKYIKKYLVDVLPICEEIIKGYVPIDTRTLQDSLKAYSNNWKYGIIEVSDIILDYSEKANIIGNKAVFDVQEQIRARVLARILDVGIGTFKVKPKKRELLRTRNADIVTTGTSRRDPTRDWWENALSEIDSFITPIADKYFILMTDEITDKIFLNTGWEKF